MPQETQQTFSDVQPLPQSFTDVTPIAGAPSSLPSLSTTPRTDADWNSLKDKYGLPHEYDLSKTLMENFATNPNLKKGQINGIDIDKLQQAWNEVHPTDPTPTSFLGRSWDEVKNLFKGAFGDTTATVAGSPGANPLGTIAALKSRASEVTEHPAAAAGAATVDLAAAALPFVGETALENLPGGVIRNGWRKIGNPMGLASTGEELITQGVSPRTSMTNWKPSLERAAGDLKAYDAQNPIKSVQDLNDAIPEIKQKIWTEEVEPALARQATKPVDMQPVADAVRKQITPEMKEFDEPSADKLEAFATKLESARDVKGANALLKYVNGQLESYFQKFPAARRANLTNNPETAGWEAARAELRNQFLTTLEDAGETGVRDARLRYGAFDTLQDAVERRVNVADRAKPMSLGRIVGLAGAFSTHGASILAGELSNYLNKPDVLIRRGINKLPEAPIRTTPFAPASAVSPITGESLAAPDELFKRANQ